MKGQRERHLGDRMVKVMVQHTSQSRLDMCAMPVPFSWFDDVLDGALGETGCRTHGTSPYYLCNFL